MIARFRTATKAAALLLSSFPQLAAAAEGEGFTGADVLAWSEAQQDSYFQTSVGMAAIVAARTGQHEDVATCLNSWYGDTSSQPERNGYIRKKLAEYPSYHPQGIILAVIEEACGDFKRD